MKFFREESMMIECQLYLWLIGGILYTLGAIIYAVRFPECCSQGRFDIVGSSHQIFHWSIFLAAVIHFYASVNEYFMRQMNQCPVI